MSPLAARLPAHVTENPGELPGGLPRRGRGLRAEAVRRARPRRCWSARRPDCVSAARFTRSGVLAAPVVLTKERTRLDALRVVVANSGNANAATGNGAASRRRRACRARRRWPAACARTRSRSPRPA